MESGSSNLRIRDALERLTSLAAEPCSERERAAWIEKLSAVLTQLEHALDDEASLKAEFFKDTARSHPRLLSTCAEFFEDSRQLLRQATFVVLLSTRAERAQTMPVDDLRRASEALIAAVGRHQRLAAELIVEAGHDIGGQG